MAEDWAVDVKKYVPNADDGVIAAIVRYLGIALQKRDSSLVAFTDPAETDRVRENYLKKKLGLTDPDSVLDRAIADVGERMKADHTKNRVTVYYLLAERFRKLHLFGGEDTVIERVRETVRPDPIVRSSEPMAAAAAVGATAALSGGYAERRTETKTGGGLGWLPWVLGLLALAALALFFLGRRPAPTPVAEVTPAPAPVVAAPAPVVAPTPPVMATNASVHFALGSAALTADDRQAIRAAADSAKADGSTLTLTGYTDNTGNTPLNQGLAKRRAEAVRAALMADGVASDRIVMQAPAAVEVGQGPAPDAEARRVDIVRR